MRNGFLLTLTTLLAATGLAGAQPADPATPPSAQPSLSPPDAGARSAEEAAAGPARPHVGGPAPALAGWNDKPYDPGRFWFTTEYLVWWYKQGALPPLVLSNPFTGLPQPIPIAQVLFPGSTFDNNDLYRQGGRFTAGTWLDPQRTRGGEASFFFLAERSVDFLVGGNGLPNSPLIGRPFFNANRRIEDLQLVNAPGVLAGLIGVRTSGFLYGFEVNGLANLDYATLYRLETLGGAKYRLDGLAGFRFLQLQEDLRIDENLTIVPGQGFASGTNFGLSDEFGTRNRFYGVQAGLRGELRWGDVYFNSGLKLGIGGTQQSVLIDGSTQILPPGQAGSVQRGGLYALPTNLGRTTKGEFGFVPEFAFNWGIQYTRHLRGFVGYTLLYWNNVIRVGDQVDLVVNPTQVPSLGGGGVLSGPARPRVPFKTDDLWVQGLNIGFELRY